jgi:hypothetical protein
VQFIVITYDHRTDPVTVAELGPFPTVAAAVAALEQDGWQLSRRHPIPVHRCWGKPSQAALLRPRR